MERVREGKSEAFNAEWKKIADKELHGIVAKRELAKAIVEKSASEDAEIVELIFHCKNECAAD